MSLKIGNEEIERIGSNCKTKFFKFVGIHLDEHLSWDFQINHVCSKLSSGNFAISRAKHFVPRQVRMSMYNSFFKCYCDFGILAWGGVKPSKIHKIVQLQKKCIRNVAGKGHRTHADPLFSAFRALKFEDMFKYSCATFMHKYVQSRVPSSFHGFLNALPPPNRTNGFHLDLTQNKFLEQFPTFFLPKIWNKLPLNLKNMESHGCFKREMQTLLLSSYPPEYKCSDKKCPDCRPQVIYLAR